MLAIMTKNLVYITNFTAHSQIPPDLSILTNNNILRKADIF